MKNIIYLSFILIIISCQKEDSISVNEVLDSLKVNKKQIIEFKLVSDTLIVGKEGTRIFVRKDMFKNYNNGLLTLELIEYFDFEDIVLNSIETITNDNQLLETSGVLYVNFKENGEQLILNEKATYKIEVSKNIKKKSNIYYNDNDSVFKWELSNDKIYVDIPDRFRNFQFGLSVEGNGKGGFFKTVHIDSVEVVMKRDSLLAIQYVENRNEAYNNTVEIFEFNASRLGYINIDRILAFEKEELITIIEPTKSFTGIQMYYIYKDNDSFYQDYWNDTNSDFKSEVKILGKIKVVVFATKNSEIYLDSFNLDSESKTTFTIDLTKTTIEKLKIEMIR